MKYQVTLNIFLDLYFFCRVDYCQFLPIYWWKKIGHDLTHYSCFNKYHDFCVSKVHVRKSLSPDVLWSIAFCDFCLFT